jgi:hypothetical protein
MPILHYMLCNHRVFLRLRPAPLLPRLRCRPAAAALRRARSATMVTVLYRRRAAARVDVNPMASGLFKNWSNKCTERRQQTSSRGAAGGGALSGSVPPVDAAVREATRRQQVYEKIMRPAHPMR